MIRRALPLAIGACAGAAALAAPAAGNVRSLTEVVEYEPPAPSLTPDPAADPANQNLLRSFTVAYDTDAGSVAVTGDYNGPAADGQNGLPDAIRVGCGRAEIKIEIDDRPGFGGTPTARATLSGFEGQVETPIAYEGAAERFTLSHQEFLDLDLRCIRFADRSEDEPEWSGRRWFEGYSPEDVAERDDTYLTVGPFRWQESEPVWLAVRPRRFGFWGRSMAESAVLSGVRWSHWTATSARGAGYTHALHGRINRRGKLVFDKYRVTLVLSAIRLCGDRYEFTRVTFKTRFGTHRMRVPRSC